MSTDDLALWGIGTSRTLRAHWMLLELGLEYDCHPIEARTGETMTEAFLELNPRHKVPVLCHGALVLSESAAIVTYLGETFELPADFHGPRDSAGRAKLNEWCYFIMTELDAHPLYLIRRHRALAHIYGPAPEAVASAEAYFRAQIEAMAGRFPGPGGYLLGARMSVADILMVTTLNWALAYDIPLPAGLLDYRRRLADRPAYKRAYETNFPGRPADGPG